MYMCGNGKYPLFLSDFNEIQIFSTDFLKNTQVLHLMKTHPVGAELFHTDGCLDGQTDGQTGRS